MMNPPPHEPAASLFMKELTPIFCFDPNFGTNNITHLV